MAIPTYQDIKELVKQGLTIEAQEKIMELREAALAIQEENLALRKQLTELREQVTLKDAMDFDGRVYWKTDPAGQRQDGPFCPLCFDDEGKSIRLQHLQMATGYGERSDTLWHCRKCGHQYDSEPPPADGSNSWMGR